MPSPEGQRSTNIQAKESHEVLLNGISKAGLREIGSRQCPDPLSDPLGSTPTPILTPTHVTPKHTHHLASYSFSLSCSQLDDIKFNLFVKYT